MKQWRSSWLQWDIAFLGDSVLLRRITLHAGAALNMQFGACERLLYTLYQESGGGNTVFVDLLEPNVVASLMTEAVELCV